MEENKEKLKHNMEIQLEEIESLQAMFYNPGEIRIEDHCALIDAKDFASGKTGSLEHSLDFTVNLNVEEVKFEFCVSLPHNYPDIEPEVFVRNHLLNRHQHVDLNKQLGEFINTLPRGEPCIFTAISWLQESALNFIQPQKEIEPLQKIESIEKIVRYWIYSHHIYSKTKRRASSDLANQLNLTGFLMPGKPGVICIEGCLTECNEWWQTIRSMNWKKIICKVTEEDQEQKGKEFLKFKNFEEVVFSYPGGARINHMDKGEFYKYLEEHELGYIFKELFGVEAKSS